MIKKLLEDKRFIKDKDNYRHEIYKRESYLITPDAEVVMFYGKKIRLQMSGKEDVITGDEYRGIIQLQELLEKILARDDEESSEPADESEM